MKKEVKEKAEKIFITIQAVTGSEDSDGRSINTFKDKRAEELKITRRDVTEMMDRIEEIVDEYKTK